MFTRSSQEFGDSCANSHPLEQGQIGSWRYERKRGQKSRRQCIPQNLIKTKPNSQFDMIMDCLLIHMGNIIVNLHYGRLVTTSVAIVGCRENSHHRSIVLPLIPLHNKLMGSCNEVKIVDVGELFCNILPECVPCASWGNSPTAPTSGDQMLRQCWEELMQKS